MTTLMRGAYAVRTLIEKHLKNVIPHYEGIARSQWQDYNFTSIGNYQKYEALTWNHGDAPMVTIAVSRASEFTVVDFDPNYAQQYRPRYTVRVFLYCATPDSQEDVVEDARNATLRQRDDLASIVRASILSHGSLGTKDILDLVPGTYTEEYSDGSPAPNASGRWIAACVHVFDVRMDEGLYMQEVGNVPETGVEVSARIIEKEA